RLERAIVLGFRRHAYALAAVLLLGILSASALAEMRRLGPEPNQVFAVFDGKDTLILPEGYRNWVSLGPGHNVYVSPTGYGAYAESGSFPEGTLMVWEPINKELDPRDRPHKGAPALLASVKDNTRFAGGWGFFDFTGAEGALKTKAAVLPESSGCRACHQQ